MGAVCIFALVFLAGVPYTVAKFCFLGVIPAFCGAHKIASDAPDAFKTHIFADSLCIGLFSLLQCSTPLPVLSYRKTKANARTASRLCCPRLVRPGRHELVELGVLRKAVLERNDHPTAADQPMPGGDIRNV